MLRSLLVDFNSYFASVEQQLDPKLRGKPVGVVPMLADTTCCIAASYEAKAFGVKTGTMVKDARRMCPGIVLIQAQHEKYVKMHHEAVKLVESVAPIRRVLSIDEMECELTGSWQQKAKALLIAQQIKQALLAGLGPCMRASVGIAPNTLLSKLASNMHKPDGLTVLEMSDIPEAILHLSPQAINGIGPRMMKRLEQSRITTMQQLYNAPREVLRTIWGGVGGAQMYDILRGQWQEVSKSPTRSIGHSHVLPPDMRNVQGACDVLNRLIQKAVMRLRKIDHYATAMSVHIRCIKQAGKREYWERKTHFQESNDTVLFLKAFAHVWQQSPPKKPLGVGITLYGLRPASQHQLSLFDTALDTPAEHELNTIPAPHTPPRRDRTHLLLAVDQLNQAFGKNTLFFASTQRGLGHAPMRIAFNHIPDVETEVSD